MIHFPHFPPASFIRAACFRPLFDHVINFFIIATEHVVLRTQTGDCERICCMFVNQANSVSMELC